MLSTNIPPVTCMRCGWQNEPTARMCGGCGMPLRSSDPGATSNVDIVGNLESSALPNTPEPGNIAYPHDAPTAYAPYHDQPPQANAYSVPVVTAPSRQQGDAPATWAGPAVAGHSNKHMQTQARSPWWRIPLIVLVVLSVLVGSGLGAWAFIIRPPIHAQVDSSLRSSLNSAIEPVTARISQLPRGQTLQLTVSASEVDQQIQRHMPAGSSISDVRLHFANDSVQISYVLNGSVGAITTHLQITQGRLQAQATTVDYPLAFVEDGNEMEGAINDAFARLQVSITILAVGATNETLTLKVHTK